MVVKNSLYISQVLPNTSVYLNHLLLSAVYVLISWAMAISVSKHLSYCTSNCVKVFGNQMKIELTTCELKNRPSEIRSLCGTSCWNITIFRHSTHCVEPTRSGLMRTSDFYCMTLSALYKFY